MLCFQNKLHQQNPWSYLFSAILVICLCWSKSRKIFRMLECNFMSAEHFTIFIGYLLKLHFYSSSNDTVCYVLFLSENQWNTIVHWDWLDSELREFTSKGWFDIIFAIRKSRKVLSFLMFASSGFLIECYF